MAHRLRRSRSPELELTLRINALSTDLRSVAGQSVRSRLGWPPAKSTNCSPDEQMAQQSPNSLRCSTSTAPPSWHTSNETAPVPAHLDEPEVMHIAGYFAGSGLRCAVNTEHSAWAELWRVVR